MANNKRTQAIPYLPIQQSWFARKYNQLIFWWHEENIWLLVEAFCSTRYPHTGIALRPEDLQQWAAIMKWSAKKLKRVMDICIMHDIIRDQPASKVKGSKQFYYILNPHFL